MKLFGKLSFIYTSSFFLLFCFFYDKATWIDSPFVYSDPPKLLLESKKRLMKSFHDKKLIPLALGLVFGGKQGLSQEIKRPYMILGMSHVFTPSGLHLASLLSLLVPVTFFLQRKRKEAVRRYVTLFICTLIFFLPQMHSLKRLALLRILSFFVEKIYAEIPFYTLFLITFLIDFIFGTYASSPLSFSYSYLCLGIILSDLPHPILLPFALGGGQLIIQYFNSALLPLLAPFFNSLLSTLFTFIYPLIFFSFWLHCDSFLEFLLRTYHKGVALLATHSFFLGFIYPTLPLLLILLIFSFKQRKGRFLIIPLFLLSSPSVNNFKPSSSPLPFLSPAKREIWSLPKEKDLISSKLLKQKDGVVMKFKDKKSCRLKIFTFGPRYSCSGPRPRP